MGQTIKDEEEKRKRQAVLLNPLGFRN